MKNLITLLLVLFAFEPFSWSQAKYESDIFKTSKGELKITFIGHGTLMLEFNHIVIHVDPWSKVGDYAQLPKADLILITHHHGDHLDKTAIDQVSKEGTEIYLTSICAEQLGKGTILANGDIKTFQGINILAVPAYNLVHMNKDGKPFHAKGDCNGYVITFADLVVYVAGDTENFPEMADLKNIDIAFLPMNLPYTMTPEMVAEAVKSFSPKILYPYHYGDKADTEKLIQLLKNKTDCEVRIRKF